MTAFLFPKNQRGAALVAAILIILMVTAISATFLTMAHNMRMLMYGVSGGRTYAYYRAQGGIVDAQFRIRHNFLDDLNGAPANGFRDPTFAPNYYISLKMTAGAGQTNYTSGSTYIQISAAAGGVASGVRTITATGREYDR